MWRALHAYNVSATYRSQKKGLLNTDESQQLVRTTVHLIILMNLAQFGFLLCYGCCVDDHDVLVYWTHHVSRNGSQASLEKKL